MTTKELVEVLNALKNSADSEKKSADSANHSDNFFMTSPLFAKMIATLNVMEHDFGSEGKNSFVLFQAKDAAEKIALAAKIYEDEEDEGKSSVQFN
mmetsp:Transcript_6253/g.14160  ORF Transcript_6253/g.14160 Transcript_6253/m.14160 type:complete len:96 (-) Transcript_6253:46-333(-)